MRWTHAPTVTAVALAGVSGVSQAGAGSWAAPIRAAAFRNASVESVSCASPGNCSAGGFYNAGVLNTQAFVISEKNWHWGKPIEVPGSGRINSGGGNGGDAEVESVSCAAPGDCGAGGFYTDGSGNEQAFVVSEKSAHWGNAIEVPGSGRLNAQGVAQILSVSCGAPGDCGAGGFYSDRSGNVQAFVVSEKSARWGNTIEVPGSGRLNASGNTEVGPVSCAAPGDCAVGGTAAGAGLQGFVVSQRNGVWGEAAKIRF